MRRFIKIVLVVFVLLIIAVIALPQFIPAEKYKNQLIAQVKKATGRDLQVDGAIKASIYPLLGIEMEKVSLSSPAGFEAKELFKAEKLIVQVKLAALLNRELEIKKILLEKPDVQLEVNSAGKSNWDFALPQPQKKVESSGFSLITSAHAAEAPAQRVAQLKDISLQAVEIKDGTLSYRVAGMKQPIVLQAVQSEAALKSLDEALDFTGSALWNGEKVELQAHVAEPLKVNEGGATAAVFSLKSAPLTVDFKGTVTQSGADGTLTLRAPSLPKLAAFGGSAFAWKGKAALDFKADGALHCTLSECALKQAVLVLDDTVLKGEMKAAFGGKIPFIGANLAIDLLDINPYLSKQAFKWPALIEAAQAAEWNGERMDFSALKLIDADIALKAASIKADRFTLGATEMRAKIASGVLAFSVPNTKLYGGQGKIDGTLNASGALKADMKVAGIQAEPFLKDAMDFERLSGTGAFNLNITSQLTSQRALMENLNGNGNVKFTDGAIKGVDLAAMARNVTSGFQAGSESQKTDFSEMGGSFTLARGVLNNQDFLMKAPLLRATGAGAANLPQQTVNYRLEPMLVSSLQGQNGVDKAGLAVPIIVRGSFDHLTFTPDLNSVARQAMENPEALKATVNSVKEQLKGGNGKEGLKNLLQGFGKQ